MTKIRVSGFSLSADGFGAGPGQSLTDPLGGRGEQLHEWLVGTRTFPAMFGDGTGSADGDDSYARRSMTGFGAFVLDRNMFGPIRGPWPSGSWRGWWATTRPITRRPSS